MGRFKRRFGSCALLPLPHGHISNCDSEFQLFCELFQEGVYKDVASLLSC